MAQLINDEEPVIALVRIIMVVLTLVSIARAGIADSKNTLTKLQCHRMLAEVAHGRGDTEEAENELRMAMEEAKSGGWRYLVLLCARDLKKLVLNIDGRGAEGDAMIDEVCVLMGKGRGRFAAELL